MRRVWSPATHSWPGVTNETAAERLRNIFATQVATFIAAVAPRRSEVATRSGLVAAQLLGIALTRYLLRLPPVAAMSRDEVVHLVGPTIQRYVTGR